MESLVLETDKQLQRLQPPQEAPSNIADYTGAFSAIIGGLKVHMYNYTCAYLSQLKKFFFEWTTLTDALTNTLVPPEK